MTGHAANDQDLFDLVHDHILQFQHTADARYRQENGPGGAVAECSVSASALRRTCPAVAMTVRRRAGEQ